MSESNARLILFNWPSTVFARANTLPEQTCHVLSEIDEIAEAMPGIFPDPGQRLGAEFLRFLREMADLDGSLETFWHVVARVYGWDVVRDVFAWVEKKNANHPRNGQDYYGGCRSRSHVLVADVITPDFAGPVVTISSNAGTLEGIVEKPRPGSINAKPAALAALMIKHGLIHGAAIGDPEGYDGGETLTAINRLAADLAGA